MTDPNELIKVHPQQLMMADRGLALTSIAESLAFAEYVIEAGLAPSHFKKAASLVVAIQYGAEIGLPPMQSINSIAVINGKPSIFGDALPALVWASGKCAYMQEGYIRADGTDTEDEPRFDEGSKVTVNDKMGAWIELRRTDEQETIVDSEGKVKPFVHRRQFTVGEAKRAKLWMKKGYNGKDTPWVTYPQRMLQMRARSWMFRDYMADVLCGLNVIEEINDYPPEARGIQLDVAPVARLDMRPVEERTPAAEQTQTVAQENNEE